MKKVTKLVRLGDELAIPLDKSVLDELGIDENTPLEVSVRGQSILVSPESKIEVTHVEDAEWEKAAKQSMAEHAKALKELKD